ncbi:MAG: PH domain-containing protein [Chitinophagaceae bacterium]|nr:PH domain-containing protein [Chitinophagaceae bacterium]
MIFQNSTIDMALLPKAEEVELTPIEKDYLKVMRLEWLLISGILLLASGFLVFIVPPFQTFPGYIFIIAAFILIIVFYYILQTLAFKKRAYALREKDIIYQNGIIIQQTSICPFNRIQNSSVSTGPFERKYGLATLHLFTAGTSGADLHIKGLKESDAQSIKEWIAKKTADEEPATA